MAITTMGNFTVILQDYDTPKPLPIVGEVLYAYDDGKIRLSRQFKVKVLANISYAEASEDLKEALKESAKECPWIFEEITDYFIKVEVLNLDTDNKEPMYFARMKTGGWFTIEYNDWCWYTSELDTDGELTKQLEKEMANE